MLAGYLEFLVLLFLPGLAVLEIFKLGGDLSLAERLGLAFGLSMGVDVLVMAFRTSGLVIGGLTMTGIYPGTLELILGASVVAFLVPVVIRRKVVSWAVPLRYDLLVLGAVAAQALLVVAHFEKYPVFPEYQSADFLQHVQITQSLASGEITVFPGGILYYGIHLLMGSLGALSGGLLLQVTQYAMGILLSLSPLLLYAAVCGLSLSKRIGFIACVVYVAAGFVWFGSVFNAGLYANFYGLLAMLLVFALVPVVLKSPRSPGVWVAFAVAIGNGYLSHYSFVTIIPALFALPIGELILERKLTWPRLAVPLVVLLPAAVVAAAKPGMVGLMLSFLQASGQGSISGNTALSQALSGWPVLRYLIIEITNDLAALVLIFLGVFGAYLALRGKNPLAWTMVIWDAALLLVAPFSDSAWRFSYMALLPTLIIACFALDWVVPTPRVQLVKRSKMYARRDTTNYRWGALALLFVLLVANSWSWKLVADAASDGSQTATVQNGILASMRWINSSTPSNSDFVSVTSSYYYYILLIYQNRQVGYYPLGTPDEIAAASAGLSNPVYVILTQVGTVAGVNASDNPYTLFPSDSSFKMVYNDSGVSVFKLQ